MMVKGYQSQRLHLLEEWPSAQQKKRVTFSKYSTNRIYHCSELYRSDMSYTSADRRVFQAEAAREGRRIRHLISTQSVQTGIAIQNLITLGLLSKEELLGIEDLISNDAAVRLLKERRPHIALVLRAQKEMQEKNEENADKLAQFAICSSSKSIQKARLRAALAV